MIKKRERAVFLGNRLKVRHFNSKLVEIELQINISNLFISFAGILGRLSRQEIIECHRIGESERIVDWRFIVAPINALE